MNLKPYNISGGGRNTSRNKFSGKLIRSDKCSLGVIFYNTVKL